VALIATTSILVDSEIWAFGSGGHGGTGNESGGGGGGSGGMVVLEAPMVMESVAAKIFANGGGGGQGGAPPGAMQADVGKDGGESTGPAILGPGGLDVTKVGGPGGDGSAAAQLLGRGGSQGGASGGGGAGGGGAGFVHAPGVDPTRVSPVSQDLPPSS
jgi:hypothetical protein